MRMRAMRSLKRRCSTIKHAGAAASAVWRRSLRYSDAGNGANSAPRGRYTPRLPPGCAAAHAVGEQSRPRHGSCVWATEASGGCLVPSSVALHAPALANSLSRRQQPWPPPPSPPPFSARATPCRGRAPPRSCAACAARLPRRARSRAASTPPPSSTARRRTALWRRRPRPRWRPSLPSWTRLRPLPLHLLPRGARCLAPRRSL